MPYNLQCFIKKSRLSFFRAPCVTYDLQVMTHEARASLLILYFNHCMRLKIPTLNTLWSVSYSSHFMVVVKLDQVDDNQSDWVETRQESLINSIQFECYSDLFRCLCLGLSVFIGLSNLMWFIHMDISSAQCYFTFKCEIVSKNTNKINKQCFESKHFVLYEF